MDSEGPLLTIAEISVALVGFASIVVAIRGASPSEWSRQDRFGLANVFAASLAVLLGSLVPFPLHQLALSEGAVWSTSNALFAVMLVAYLSFLVVSQRGSPRRRPRPRESRSRGAGWSGDSARRALLHAGTSGA